jgi:hypothetical protein
MKMWTEISIPPVGTIAKYIFEIKKKKQKNNVSGE